MKKIYLIPAILLLISCHSMKDSSETKSVKSELFTLIYSAENHGREKEENCVINTDESYNALLKSVGSEVFPVINFDKSQVVALFMGTKSTGGYRISIDSVVEEDGKIIVYKKVENPSGGRVTTALTQPFVIAEIHSKKEIIFR